MIKTPVRKEPILIKLIGGVFIGLPLVIARSLLMFLLKIERPVIKKLMIGVLISVSVLCTLGFGRVFDFLILFFQSRPVSPGVETGVRFGLFYLMYVMIFMPVFLLIAYFNQEARLFKPDIKKREPNPNRMRQHRLKSDYNKVYIGQSLDTGKPLYLTNDQRQMHCEVVGSTGTGKTESFLLPVLAHDIAHGKGAVIIDGKGDLELLNRIHYIVKRMKRAHDFFFFSLAHPDQSNTYNPLLQGNPTELKDKLVNSMPWSEEFYRRMAEQASLTLFNAIASRKKNKACRFRDLHTYLTDINALKRLSDETQDHVLNQDIGKMVKSFKDNQKFLSGLMADLYLTSRSGFSDLLDTTEPEIDLLRLYEKNQICYFALDLQKYADTSRRLGRMIIQDIRAVSSHIQATIPEARRHFFPVFIDDASSFLEVNFIDFLNKCRASGFSVTILHQSLGDLVFRGFSNFQQQVMENTNIKIILRQDDPWSVEKFTKIGGTRRTVIPTYQTEEKIIGKGFTGTGSVREGQTFRIEPDLIRALKRGEAVMIWKSPSLFTGHVKLDFFGHPRYPGIYKLQHPPYPKEEKRTQPKRVLFRPRVSDFWDGENPLEVIQEVKKLRNRPA